MFEENLQEETFSCQWKMTFDVLFGNLCAFQGQSQARQIEASHDDRTRLDQDDKGLISNFLQKQLDYHLVAIGFLT